MDERVGNSPGTGGTRHSLQPHGDAERRRPPFTLDPGNNDQHHYVSTFWPSEVRASADTSVVYVESVDHADRGDRFFFDTASGVGHGSEEFHDAEHLSWAFDDLAVGVTIDGIVAFTPKAS